MEVLAHFLFELVKIALLATCYTTVVQISTRLLAHRLPSSWFAKVYKRKTRLWFVNRFFISVGLFIFMFSYWGDHGLGDSARIPVGHFKAVEQAQMTFITPTGYENEVLTIGDFCITDDFVIAEIAGDRPAAANKKIAIWNLESNSVEFLDGLEDVDVVKFKKEQGLTGDLEFLSFEDQYDRYWNRWRFYFLP